MAGRRRYSEAMKQKALRLVLAHKRPVSEVARELEIGEGTLYFWVRRQKEARRVRREKPRHLGWPVTGTIVVLSLSAKREPEL